LAVGCLFAVPIAAQPPGPEVAPAPRRVPKIDPAQAKRVLEVMARFAASDAAVAQVQADQKAQAERTLTKLKEERQQLLVQLARLTPDQKEQRADLEARVEVIDVSTERL